MPSNQANQAKHEAERWEDFLDTVFARSRKIKEIQISQADSDHPKAYMQSAGYDGLCMGLAEEPPHLWGLPIVIDHSLTSPKIVYHEGILPPEHKPIKKEKPIDIWLDDEV